MSECTSLGLRLGRSKKNYKEIDCDALNSIAKEFRLIIHSMASSHETRIDESRIEVRLVDYEIDCDVL